MPETPRQPTEQLELTDKQNAKINHAWTMRIAIILLLSLGAVAAKMCGRPDTEPYTMSDLEKQTNEQINKTLIKKGGVLASNGNVIPPDAKDRVKEGNIVLLRWPGSRKRAALKKDTKGDTKFEKEEQKEQKFPINENCVERMEQFRRCVNRTLHADPRIISGFQSSGLMLLRTMDEVRLLSRLKCKIRGIWNKKIKCSQRVGFMDRSPLLTGECAFELSPVDATTGKIPHRLDKNGLAVTLDDEKVETGEDRKKVKELMMQAGRGQIGLHDLAMECGIQARFLGSHCNSRSANPFLFEPIENIDKNDPRYGCTRESSRYKENRAQLEQTPPPESLNDAHGRLKQLGRKLKINWAKEWGKKGLEGLKRGGKKVLDWGARGIDWVLRRRKK